MTSDDLHLLVLGSPRSGTTLLSAMLSCHPDVCILNEELTGASRRIFSKRVKGVKLCIPHQIELDHPKSMRGGDWLGAQVRRVTNLGRRLLSRPLPKGGFKKSALSIRDYRNAAERLAIIGIVRGPEPVVASIMRRGNQTRATAEYRWRRCIEILHTLVTDQDDRTFVKIVRFDDLVTSPEETLKRALGSLGCDFSPAVLEGFRHTPQYRGRTSIDPSLAGPGLEAELEHPLLERDPELSAKFRALHDLGNLPAQESV